MNFKVITTAMLSMCIAITVSAQTIAEEPKKEKAKYAENVLAIAPIQLSENGVAGLGFSYERSLDKAGIIALYVPLSVVMNTNSEQRLGSNAHYNDPMVYVMPGLKIYPTGNQGLAKYAIGPSIVFATGQRTVIDNPDIVFSTYPYGYYPPSTYTTRQHNILGMMINQSLNINPTPHLYVGTEFGFGFSYMNKLDGISQQTTGLVQFSFKVGYRF
ncbi:MAG: hypothetical protein JWQ38_674 [Flavipsychrobacter sp.]|nr:hypothetical protein [Flavipsychrobacter sp.]